MVSGSALTWGERIVYWIIILGLLALVSLYRGGRGGAVVKVNGQPIVWVASASAGQRAIEKAKQMLSQREGVGVTFFETVSVEPRERPPDIIPVSEEEAYQTILQRVTPAVRAAVIQINGKNTVALPTVADAEQTLLWVQKKVLPVNELLEKPTFKEKVEIRRARVPLDRVARDPEKAADRLLRGEGESQYHEVKKGEVAVRIAARYRLSLSQLQALNPGRNLHRLQIGDRLIVRKSKPFLTVVSKHRVVEKLPVPFSTERKIALTLKGGQTKIARKGRPGVKEVTYFVTCENGREVSRQVWDERILQEPVAEVLLVGGGQR